MLVAAADQLIKAGIREIPLGRVFFEIPGLVSLTHCVNTGAAFSVLSGHPLVLAAFSLALLAVVWGYAASRMHLTKRAWIALSCLIGGGVGNLLDRLLRAGVTDYIHLQFIDFPVFNLADMAITGSIAMLLILLVTDTLENTSEE
ncbi:MAG: signal peptidase II [Clostridia bacterium]|nr:signal peptidase II [Clostridia bacterium]